MKTKVYDSDVCWLLAERLKKSAGVDPINDSFFNVLSAIAKNGGTNYLITEIERVIVSLEEIGSVRVGGYIARHGGSLSSEEPSDGPS